MNRHSDNPQVLADAYREITRAERLLEVAHVAHRLRVSQQYVRRICRTGQLPAVRIGRLWRIRPSSLDAFLAAQSSATKT